MSSMDENKWQIIASALNKIPVKEQVVQVINEINPDNDPTAIYENSPPILKDEAEIIDFEDLYMYFQEVVASNDLQESVTVEMSSSGVYMTFRDNVFFAPDSDILLEEGEYILEIISDGIRQIDELILAIRVNGHTAQSVTSDANEWTLSTGRANSVVNFMISLDACEDRKFSATGFGKYRPVDENETEEGRRQNRRVEIVFIRNDIDFTDPEVVNELLSLEYGSGFVTPSDADGNTDAGSSAAEYAPAETAADSGRSDPDITYVPKGTSVSG
jgi:chemotaxis protein MotB